MNDKPKGTPPTAPSFHGTDDQRRAVERWEKAGWTFLHWTEVPKLLAVLDNVLGVVIFIDEYGWAWKGPIFSKRAAVPLDKYPLVTRMEKE